MNLSQAQRKVLKIGYLLSAESLQTWLSGNYRILGVDEVTIKNYLDNGNLQMQIQGIKNFLKNT